MMQPTTERELTILMDATAALSLRRAALEKLAALADPEAVAPLAVLLTEIELPLIHDLKRTLDALDATSVLASEMQAGSAEARARAVRLLGYLENDAAIPSLLRALEDDDPGVRALAADGLIRLRPTSVIDPLASHLFGDPEPQVRMAAAQALGEIADDASLAALRRAMESEADGFVRVVLELSCHRAERICDDRELFS